MSDTKYTTIPKETYDAHRALVEAARDCERISLLTDLRDGPKILMIRERLRDALRAVEEIPRYC